MPSISYTALYSIGDTVACYQPYADSAHAILVVGEVVDHSYLLVEDKVVYDILTVKGKVTDIPEEYVCAGTDLVQRIIDIVTV